MMRAILSQGIYQLVIMYIMLFAGPFMYSVVDECPEGVTCNITYNLYQEQLQVGDNIPTYRKLHQTLMFQVFVFMNLFNMLNCRIIDNLPDPTVEASALGEDGAAEEQTSRVEYNFLKNPFANFWFWIVLFAEFNVQMIMVGYGGFLGTLFTTTPITFGMHITAVMFGLGSWGVSCIAKASGSKLVHSMPEFGEDEDALKAATRIKQAKFARADNNDADADNEEKEGEAVPQ